MIRKGKNHIIFAVLSGLIVLGFCWMAYVLGGQGAQYYMDQEIPVSERSVSSVERVAPALREALIRSGQQMGRPVYLRIFKEEKVLELWLKGEKEYALFKTYPVCTYGQGRLGPKLQEGDGIAPEGFYEVFSGQLNPQSKYHLAFNIGYPNAYDRALGRTGSAIMVHGGCASIGCFAMTDPAIEEIYALVESALRQGQPSFFVHIFPFRMSAENLERHRSAEWSDFWENLKEGYDLFERSHKQVPLSAVWDRRYVFESR